MTSLLSEVFSSKNISENLGIYMHGLRKIQLLFEGSHEERMQESIGSMKEIYSACA